MKKAFDRRIVYVVFIRAKWRNIWHIAQEVPGSVVKCDEKLLKKCWQLLFLVVIYASTRESDSAKTCPPEKSAKNLKKVLDKGNRMWYDYRAPEKSATKFRFSRKRLKKEFQKNRKKLLTKRKRCDIITRHSWERANEPWKLNNDKNETLED